MHEEISPCPSVDEAHTIDGGHSPKSPTLTFFSPLYCSGRVFDGSIVCSRFCRSSSFSISWNWSRLLFADVIAHLLFVNIAADGATELGAQDEMDAEGGSRYHQSVGDLFLYQIVEKISSYKTRFAGGTIYC